MSKNEKCVFFNSSRNSDRREVSMSHRGVGRRG